MKNLYVKFVMVLTMILGMAATVSAEGFTPYTDIDEACKALRENRGIASNLLEGGDLMNDKIKIALKDALENADAVLDDPGRLKNIGEVNAALEILLNAIYDAQKSVEEYKSLSEAIKEFVAAEKAKIDEMIEKLIEEYGDASSIPAAIKDAITQWENKLDAMLAKLKTNGASQAMLDAFNKTTQDMRDVLKAGGYDIPELEDFVADATGITSVTTSMQDNSAEYGLNGNMVSGNYKGIVIKNGKKFIKK